MEGLMKGQGLKVIEFLSHKFIVLELKLVLIKGTKVIFLKPKIKKNILPFVF